jgi:murein DD-endopeptidase MepM/ murein hydrolase activator NlpD
MRGRRSSKRPAKINLLLSNDMTQKLTGSVGRWERSAQNLPPDVETVQRLLQFAAQKLQVPELDPRGVDGEIGRPSEHSATVRAIETFQGRYTSSVDGIIPVDSHTWDVLLVATREYHEPQFALSDVKGCFPFDRVPDDSWEERPRAFASPRSGGSRLHAGCDLYFPRGTPIHAVADGVVTRGPYPFY